MGPLARGLRMTAIVVVVAIVGWFGFQWLTPEPDTLTLTATFDDVIDLVTDAGVRAGDVPVGSIEKIELTEDNEARVTMSVRRDTGLPADTEAVLAKTSLLGERFIDLRPVQGGDQRPIQRAEDLTPVSEGGTLQDGQELPTRIVLDFEDLVRTGSDVLSLVAADQLAAAVQVGATAFGGRGSTLGLFLEDIQAVIGRYEEDSDDLVRVIDALDRFTGSLAPDAELNAEALGTLRRASEVLEQEDDRLLDTLEDLTGLSETGARILENHQDELADLFRRIRTIIQEINALDGVIQRVLTWAPRHNLHVPNGSVISRADGPHFAQVWLGFELCGETDEQGNYSEDCTPPNPGEPGPQYPYHPTSEDCWDDLDACDKPEEQ